jgi:phosphoglycerate dehydrogenase-like enzyme
MGADPIHLCVLHPAFFDERLFRDIVDGCGRDIEIVVTAYYEGFELRTLKGNRASSAEIRTASPAVTGDLERALSEAEVVQALDAPLQLLDLAPRLRWVQAIGAGVWHLYPRELADAGVVVTNASGVAATAIAEFVFGRVLEHWKGLADLRIAQSERRWAPRVSRTLVGATLGVIGVGAIGSEAARLGRCFGMKVIGIRRRGTGTDVSDQVWAGPDQLHRLLQDSDVVVVAVPETDETRHMIGRDELSQMRPDAVLCNVSRGSVLDELALIEALESRRIGAAILDVTETEPLDASSPLWTTPNIYLSPHCAATTDGYRASFTTMFAENVRRYVDQQPLLNVVDPTRGY